jgi:hypothetical protein
MTYESDELQLTDGGIPIPLPTADEIESALQRVAKGQILDEDESSDKTDETDEVDRDSD